MIPDFETAARRATETLIKHNITSAPIDPLPIMKHTPGVLVTSFAAVSDSTGIERNNLIKLFGTNSDAVTTVRVDHDTLEYIVVYNQKMPSFAVQHSIARELGHIILQHDGTRHEDVRTAEALCFAHHLLSPRALIHGLQESGIKLSIDLLGNLTGCYEECLAVMQKTPATHVPADMNRRLREQFADYISGLSDYRDILTKGDSTPLATFGTYMDGYTEGDWP